MTITDEISLKNGVDFAFPGFYVGVNVSLAMVIVYWAIVKMVKDLN